jgi:RNA polymerase sigma factor (sigma-70 family)
VPDTNERLQLYLTHRHALVDYAAPIVGCRAKAEDVVQDAWLRFNQGADNANPLTQPVGYLYRIVRNLAFDLNRRTSLENRHTTREDALDEHISNTPSPEQQALHVDELRKLQHALSRLPERTRQAFILHRLQGLTFQQIGAQLGISVSLAHQLVRDALTYCAEQLSDD